jgi:hypothetical protein
MQIIYQPFERGAMLWLGADQLTLVLFRPPGAPAWTMAPDTFGEGMNSSDPALEPPVGLFQPARGFGLLWRSNPFMQSRLGWATGSEQTYSGLSQIDEEGGIRYLQGPDGTLFVLSPDQTSWWRQN